jgi:hypothetical protein
MEAALKGAIAALGKIVILLLLLLPFRLLALDRQRAVRDFETFSDAAAAP